MQNTNRLKLIFIWYLPSASELLIYGSLAILSIFISNANVVNNFLYTPSDFHLSSSILNSINSLLQRFVGDHIARAGVVAFFWALIGLLAYLFIWVVMNFSNELGNDLAIKRYTHPSGVDTSSPLRTFLSRSLFRLLVFIFLVFFLYILIVVILPICGGLFKEAGSFWPKLRAFKLGLIGVATELVALHLFTVFLRLMLLRKRVFGN